MTSRRRSEQEWANLCKSVKQGIPPPVGPNAWELVIAAALTASPESQLLAEFYTYLIQHDPSFTGSEEQRRLSLRLRDVLLKLITIIGAPQVLCALMPLAKAEGSPEAKARTSTLNPKWGDVDVLTIHDRGMKTIDTIYGRLLPKIFQSWGDHTQDVQFNEIFTVYGMYLSDFEVMTALETEAVVYTSISCTGLRGPTLWHTRGMGRLLGARGSDKEREDIKKIEDMLRGLRNAMRAVIEFVGEEFVGRANVGNWPAVDDVVKELNGWGDDE